MGNVNSSVEGTDSFFSSSKSVKVPKHLQPLKRKPTSEKPERGKAKKEPESTQVTFQRQKAFMHEDKHPLYREQLESGPPLRTNLRIERHEASNYPLPSDKPELDRQRVQYYIFRWAFENRHIVPPHIFPALSEGIRVLDIACGPGMWDGKPVIDMAHDFKNSTFDAVDLRYLVTEDIGVGSRGSHSDSAVAQEYNLPNFRFHLHNMLKKKNLPFDNDTFDYLQQSLTTITYSTQDWSRVIPELIRVVCPGGTIQLLEIDMIPHGLGPNGKILANEVMDVWKETHSIDPKIAGKLDHILTEAGLERVTTRFVSVPIGDWGLDIGVLWEQNFFTFLESAMPFLLNITNYSEAEYRAKKNLMKEEFKHYKSFMNIYVIWGYVPN